eukprot:c23572_g1_i2 orf=1123-2619(-)
MLHRLTLERLHISRPKKPMIEQVIPLLRSLPRLTGLELSSCSLSEPELEELVNALPCQLTSLDLHNDHLITGSCDEECRNTSRPALTTLIQELPKRCPNLKHLDLDFYSYMSTECLNNLLLTIPHIQSLHLQSDYICWVDVSKIFQTCTLLESISLISRCLSVEEFSSDEEEGSLPALPRWKNRRSRYQMTNCRIPEHVDLGSLACARLQSIRFYSSPHHSVPLDSMPVFGLLREKGQQLRHLHAQSLYNISWHTVSVWCGNLQTLDLSHSRVVPYSATGIEEVVLSGLFRIFKGLERIGLPCVTNQILIEIGRFCSKLKEIHFEGHASGSNFIHSQTKVTDLGVVALAEGCPALQVISLAGCNAVSVASLRALAFHCKHMKALLLPGCTKINDDAIAKVWPSIGKSLLVLDLVGCKITSKTIRLFYQLGQVQGTSLVVLAIARSLSKSAKSELLELQRGLPSLRISSSMFGIPWDGFFGSRSLDDLIPQSRIVNQGA